MQISMSVVVVKKTTVMRMQTALTRREVSSALAILVTLEMESTVQVRYFVNFSRIERNIPCVEGIHHLNPFCRHQ